MAVANQILKNQPQGSNPIPTNPNQEDEQVKLITKKINDQIDQLLSNNDSTLSKKIADSIDRKIVAETIKIERESTGRVGVISTIIGLGIAFVSISKDQRDGFTAAIVLLLTTCAFAIFATLMHYYFGGKEMQKETQTILKWSVVSSIILLFISIIGQKRLELIIFKNFVITNPPTQLIIFKNLFTINKTVGPAVE